MGVLSCDRDGCVNVMCDRYSHEYGHLCNECFDQLVSLGKFQNIQEFMDSEKADFVEIEDARGYFADVFEDC